MRALLLAGVVGAMVASAVPARGDIRNFDLSGKIYNKWLFQNDDSQGLLTHGNPFWPDNISGSNGVGTEFELKVKGQVSPAVRAEVRLKSRFGSLWQDWWENGDLKTTGPDTSGESLGMNHAEYLKLRGYFIDANLPIPTVRSVLVGSSDLSMFNPWTIGKSRYIDRDNAKGTFLIGSSEDRLFHYVLAAIALPKLFVGPSWSTGIGDPEVRNPLWSSDWAYGLKLGLDLDDVGSFALIGTITRDHEIDIADPDAEGSAQAQCVDGLGAPIEGCVEDHAVERVTRYSNAVATLQGKGVTRDVFAWTATLGISSSDINEAVAFNGVAGNAGVFPVVFDDVVDVAGVLRLELLDPWDFGLSLRMEGFSIGANWNTVFGARREADVLLTDGFVEGGQLPTLNLANEFMDFDERFYESCIGWYGATLVPEWEGDSVTWGAEATVIGYHTNAQNRDVDNVYPDFLHTDGFTDTDLYDYANTTDRGRDPRSVYRRNQDRLSFIGLVRGRFEPDTDMPLGLEWKGKAILDRDMRSHTTEADDYDGLRVIGQLAGDMEPTDGLKLRLGVQGEHWDEKRRRGTLELGYGDDTTDKLGAFAGGTYLWQGWRLAYHVELVYKDQDRQREPDQLWRVVRSKATLEVEW